jgi:integrase
MLSTFHPRRTACWKAISNETAPCGDFVPNQEATLKAYRSILTKHTLQATGDIRKVALWLGHESIQSTEAYLRADPAQKREMLEAVLPPTLKRGSFRPTDKFIASFRGK